MKLYVGIMAGVILAKPNEVQRLITDESECCQEITVSNYKISKSTPNYPLTHHIMEFFLVR